MVDWRKLGKVSEEKVLGIMGNELHVARETNLHGVLNSLRKLQVRHVLVKVGDPLRLFVFDGPRALLHFQHMCRLAMSM